jgi:hypothetical protein
MRSKLALVAAALVACAVPQASARMLALPGDTTLEATGPAGTTFPYDSSGYTCTPAGSTFPLGTTTVNCTDASGTPAPPFKVTVVDTTPPGVTVQPPPPVQATGPGGATVNFSVSATDIVDPSPTVSCSPSSGSTFPRGTTPVSCTARDLSGNASAPATFNVNVVDLTPPSLNVPAPITADAVGPGGAAVPFSVSATDLVDLAPTVSCTANSGQTFPLGTTTVSCTAKDASGNTSAPSTFTISVVDRGAPTVKTPGTITVEATGPSGAAATFVVSASDAVDPSPSVTCDKTSGATFPLGTSQVSCTAKDASNNTSAPAAFSVNVVDTTPPQLKSMPADITAEANSFAGSKVNFLSPTAVDIVDGPMPNVGCSPGSGSTFPLGVGTVTCSSTDSRGNRGSATFKVKIVDTTPPVIIPPGDTSVYATTDSGSYALDQGPIEAFAHGGHASDIADPHPVVSSNHPIFFGVGTTTVTFTARDASGNKASATAKLTLLPKPAPGTTPPPLPPPRENKPPGNVTGATVKAGDGRITLTWKNPTDADFDHVEITRTTTKTGFKATGTVVYRGKGTSYTDRGLQNGVEYRYVIATVDKTGNASAGVAAVVMPKANLLRVPADGARLKKVPKLFRWKPDPRASYYNLQLYAGGTLVAQSTAQIGKKILSVFPNKPVYKFNSPWKWQGRKYKMTKGLYTWYVWPGYGAREDVNYGPLMGSATFQVTPAKSR